MTSEPTGSYRIPARLRELLRACIGMLVSWGSSVDRVLKQCLSLPHHELNVSQNLDWRRNHVALAPTDPQFDSSHFSSYGAPFRHARSYRACSNVRLDGAAHDICETRNSGVTLTKQSSGYTRRRRSQRESSGAFRFRNLACHPIIECVGMISRLRA
jgi:hypothetical protein